MTEHQRCTHHPGDDPHHCVHERPEHRDAICCWCGDLFEPENTEDQHGEYCPDEHAQRRIGP